MRYLRKIESVEATQWFKPGDHVAVRLSHPWADPSVPAEPVLDTPRGTVVVTPGDYIVESEGGGHYAMRAELFEFNYRPESGPTFR